MTYKLGVDLGTTYTAGAVARDGRAEVATLGTRSAGIPSVIFLREDETILVGEAASRRGLAEPARVVREFKRRFGDPTPILVAGTPISADALMALVDQFGVPRARCACGNPLLPPKAVPTKPSYQGRPWSGFDASNVTVINASTTVINVFTIIDVRNGEPFGRRPQPGPDVALPDTTTPASPIPPTTPAPASNPGRPGEYVGTVDIPGAFSNEVRIMAIDGRVTGMISVLLDGDFALFDEAPEPVCFSFVSDFTNAPIAMTGSSVSGSVPIIAGFGKGKCSEGRLETRAGTASLTAAVDGDVVTGTVTLDSGEALNFRATRR